MTRNAPSDQRHAARAAPSSLTATTGADALPTDPEMVTAGDHDPPTVRDDASTAVCRPLITIQTAVICPALSPTSALNADTPGPERSCGGLHEPPAGRIAAWTMLSWPLERCQTATALPSLSIASFGDSVAAAGSEIRCAEDQVPPGGRNAARIDDEPASRSRQTATMLPAPSEAIRGVDPDTPPFEMSLGCSSPVADIGKMTRTTAARSAVRPSMFNSFRELCTAPPCGAPLTWDSHHAHTGTGLTFS